MTQVNEHNQLFTLTEVERLVHEGFGVVTAEQWRRMIAHTQEKVEDTTGSMTLQGMEEFTFHVGGSSDEPSSSSQVMRSICNSMFFLVISVEEWDIRMLWRLWIKC
jgi:hypothetical protein